jgi:hypothetical protein
MRILAARKVLADLSWRRALELATDRFASMLNTQLPRFNAKWPDPHCEDVDCLHLGARRRRSGGGPGGGCARRPVGTYLYLHAVGASNPVAVPSLAR